MHFTAPDGAVAEALDLISRGKDLGGRVYHALDLLGRLAAGVPPPGGWAVENALLRWEPGAAARLEFPHALRFVHCTLHSPQEVRFRGSRFLGGLFLQKTTAEAPLVFEACEFKRVELDRLTARDEVRFLVCRTREKFPLLADCRFAGPVRLEVEGRPRKDGGRVVFWIKNCQFDHDLAIVPLGGPVAVQFQHCTLGLGCRARITVGPAAPADDGQPRLELFSDLRFESSQVAGRVEVLPHRQGDRTVHRPVWVALHATSFAGELDLSAVRLRPLDVTDSSFAGGQLAVDLGQLQASDPGRATWRALVPLLTPGDAPGNLLSEALLDRDDAPPVSEEDEPENPHERVAREYGELRNAFARAAGAIEQEEFCHYKFRDHRRRARLYSIGRRGFARPRPPAAGAPALRARPTLRQALADTLEGFHLALDLVFWKWMLGYGMYARRVVATALVVIAVFAAIYAASSLDDGHALGHVASADGVLLGHRPPARQAAEGRADPADLGPDRARPVQERAGLGIALRHAIYFSAVTFTTLGYGDYLPHGGLQYVAVTEALSGGLLIAFLTVVMARKFIR